MNAIEQKLALLPFLKKYFSDRQFECKEDFEYSFTKETKFGGIRINFYFSDAGKSGNSLFEISHQQVEDVICDIGLPNKTLDVNKRLYTLYDSSKDYPYLLKPIKVGSGRSSTYIEDIMDIEKWKSEIIKYESTAGANFITEYSYLPNVHAKICQLHDDGDKNYLHILKGGTDHLFRFLIICKLCNDPFFSDKLKFIESRITKQNWIPYFTKLRDKLNLLDPIY